MGLQVHGDPSGMSLVCEGHTLQLGAAPDWNNLPTQAQNWINELADHAGADGQKLADRRSAAGFSTLDSFCEFSGLEKTPVFDAEVGISTANPVHLRILDWLEDGRLKAD